jgi:hypothetical protein
MFDCSDMEECFSEPNTEIEDFSMIIPRILPPKKKTKETNLEALLEEETP